MSARIATRKPSRARHGTSVSAGAESGSGRGGTDGGGSGGNCSIEVRIRDARSLRAGASYPADAASEPGQLPLEAFVATVDVSDSRYLTLAGCGQSRDD